MSVLYGKLTSRGQTTVPKEVRQALSARPGDMLVYRISRGRVTLVQAEPIDLAYLRAVDSTPSEWTSAEDAAAHDDW
jgi:bifunctional DNA-binding transcriptional regulator/antitoxin component of YhaV-PrlF toxin-antitoxin module